MLIVNYSLKKIDQFMNFRLRVLSKSTTYQPAAKLNFKIFKRTSLLLGEQRKVWRNFKRNSIGSLNNRYFASKSCIRTWYHFRRWRVIIIEAYSKNMKNLPRPRKWISYGHFRGLGHFRGPRRPRKWIYYSHFRGLGNWVWNFPFCDFISKFSFPTWKWSFP